MLGFLEVLSSLMMKKNGTKHSYKEKTSVFKMMVDLYNYEKNFSTFLQIFEF